MEKLHSPFIRKEIDGRYIVTDEIAEDMKWVFEDENVMAIEKLHGSNVSILIENGDIKNIWNRKNRIKFFDKNKKFIIEGLLEANKKGYMDMLPDGQHFGELIGKKVNGNPYNLNNHIWIPFKTFSQKHLRYKSWGRYPKDFNTISEWFKELLPLYGGMIHGKDGKISSENWKEMSKKLFVEGIVFTHKDGRMAKLRKDMFSWFKYKRH